MNDCLLLVWPSTQEVAVIRLAGISPPDQESGACRSVFPRSLIDTPVGTRVLPVPAGLLFQWLSPLKPYSLQ